MTHQKMFTSTNFWVVVVVVALSSGLLQDPLWAQSAEDQVAATASKINEKAGTPIRDGVILYGAHAEGRNLVMRYMIENVPAGGNWDIDAPAVYKALAESTCSDEGVLRELERLDASLTYAYVDNGGYALRRFTVTASLCRTWIIGEEAGTTQISEGTPRERSTTPQMEKTETPTYREEYVEGEQYQVAGIDGIEVWAKADCWNSSCSKVAAYIFVQNGSDQTFTVVPEQNFSLTIFDGRDRIADVATISPSEWVQKQETKAGWKAAFAGLAAGLAASGSSGYYNGGYTTNYGTSGTYWGTYTDYAANAERAARMGENFGVAIADAFQRNTVGLFVSETLYPGEVTGGRVHFEKFKKFSGATNVVLLNVKVGNSLQQYDLNFSWKLN